MVGYEEYLKEKDTLTIQQASEILNKITESLDLDNEDDQELFHDYLAAAAKYANVRANWNLLSRKQKMDADTNRTACHNKVIFHINILARYLAKQGKDTSWRDELGDEKEHRKIIGDFACYVVCLLGLSAR